MAARPLNSLFCLILACAGLPAGALAAELGEARVVSHIGQQLVADIELTSLRDDAAPVQVRLASADVYRGAGVAVPPVLAGLNLSVARRAGRQFVHATTQGQVQAEYLHLYLDLSEGNERSVRLVTLWLTPDPNPAPPVVRPVQALAAVAQPKLAAQPEPKPAPVVESKAAPQVKPAPKAEPTPVAQAKPAPKAELNPAPEVKPEPKAELKPAPEVKPAPKAELKPAPEVKSAPKAEPKPAPVAKPAPEPKAVAAAVPAAKSTLTAVPAAKAQPFQAPKPAPAVHLPLAAAKVPALASPLAPLKSAAAPVSCPQPNPALLKACVALDYKNAQLTAQIGQLEDKVKVLQLAMGRAPAAVHAAPLAHPVEPARRLVPYVAKPRKPAAPPEPDFPWLWLAVGGAVLLAGAGAAALLVRRRKAEQERKARALKATLPPVMGSVKSRLRPGNGADRGVEEGAELAQE